jgi:hypothetical protein
MCNLLYIYIYIYLLLTAIGLMPISTFNKETAPTSHKNSTIHCTSAFEIKISDMDDKFG